MCRTDLVTGSDLLSELSTTASHLISFDQTFVSLRSLSVETTPKGINNFGDGGGDKWCLDGTLSETVQINSSSLDIISLASLHSTSCSIILPYPPLCLIFNVKNTHFKTESILKLSYCWWLTRQQSKRTRVTSMLGFADSWEYIKMIAIDALRHSRVKGFNMIIWSDDLEQIVLCFSEL